MICVSITPRFQASTCCKHSFSLRRNVHVPSFLLRCLFGCHTHNVPARPVALTRKEVPRNEFLGWGRSAVPCFALSRQVENFRHKPKFRSEVLTRVANVSIIKGRKICAVISSVRRGSKGVIMKEKEADTEGAHPDLERALRDLIANSQNNSSAEAEMSRLRSDPRWSPDGVDTAFMRVLDKMQDQQVFDARSGIARSVFKGFFLWTGFVLFTHGFQQLKQMKFWFYFGVGFLLTNFIAYCLLTLLYGLLRKLVMRRDCPALIAAMLGLILPIFYVVVSVLLNRMTYGIIIAAK